MNKSRVPSEQFLEGIHAFGPGIYGSFPTRLQMWVGNPNKKIAKWLVNLGPDILERILSQYQPTVTDIVHFKAQLLGIKKIPKSFTGTSWCFGGQTNNSLVQALKKLGIPFIYFSWPDEPDEEKNNKWTIKTTAGPTFFSDETVQQLFLSVNRNFEEQKKYCTEHHGHLASREEVYDWFLDIACKAVLQNQNPLQAIRHTLKLKNKNSSVDIRCYNRIYNYNLSGQRISEWTVAVMVNQRIGSGISREDWAKPSFMALVVPDKPS